MSYGSEPINNTRDIIDSREVIERILWLETVGADPDPDDDELLLSDAETDELETLHELASQGESLSDWIHGETLIRDDYFEDYARELAEDIGAVSSDADWPANCIDWERAARELQVDYTGLDFDGVTYWARA